MSNVQIEHKFGVDEATVRYWVKHGIKEDQRKNNEKVADFDEIEKDLAQNLLSIREKGHAVTSSVIYQEMEDLIANRFNISKDEYKLLQNFARYCGKKNLKHDFILTIKSNEEVLSYNDKNEEIKLTKDKFLNLETLKLQAKISCYR